MKDRPSQVTFPFPDEQPKEAIMPIVPHLIWPEPRWYRRLGCIFINPDKLRLPVTVNGAVCGVCGLVHGNEVERCGYCGAELISSYQ